MVAILEISGPARALTVPGQAGTPERWSVDARTEEVTVSGTVIRTRAELVVMGGRGWDNVVPGQLVRAAGKLRPPEPGQQETAILAASMAPGAGAAGGLGAGAAPVGEVVAKELRERYVAAASFLAADPRGLLPGMVTGDTSALDEGLNAAMKTVGMTHLTAVSGANCSLVLGALLMAARSLRLPRIPAACLALTGLGMFVVLVGPDASVLRAALMGSIAIASLAGGRMGRGLSFLCLAVMGLLLIDPGLATSFGFLLSVLATLGIIVLGSRMMDWTPPIVPRWAAAALAVPLSAQLLCGPVIVLLQPQFSTYSLLANIVAAPLVAPVTLLGTAAVPLVLLDALAGDRPDRHRRHVQRRRSRDRPDRCGTARCFPALARRAVRTPDDGAAVRADLCRGLGGRPATPNTAAGPGAPRPDRIPAGHRGQLAAGLDKALPSSPPFTAQSAALRPSRLGGRGPPWQA